MRHYVYELTNQISNKKYIGVRSTNIDPCEDTYMSSSQIVKKLIKMNIPFKKEILSEWETRADAQHEEARLHQLHNVSCNSEYYNLANAPFNGQSGTYLKGRTYEEIFGDEKAKKIKAQKSQKLKNRQFSYATRQKMSQNHADISGANNPRALKGSIQTKDNIILFEFSTKAELVEYCRQNDIPYKRLYKTGSYNPPITIRNKKFSKFFGLHIVYVTS